MHVIHYQTSNVALLIYKVIAAIMVVGSIGGLISNSRCLLRFGMTHMTSGWAIAGLMFSIIVLLASLHVLRLPLLKGGKPT